MRVVSRVEWGARAASLPTVAMTLPAREVWLHHTTSNVTSDPKRDMRTVEAIGLQRFGIVSYSYCIHPTGMILEGAGLRRGAHTAQRNSTSFGISHIGNYETLEPTTAQLDATRWLIWWLQDEGYLRRGTYPTGGHRDTGMATACPGTKLYRRLDALRVPWFQPEAPLQPSTLQPAPVHDYEEAATKTTMLHCGPLDKDGNGWADWQPGFGRDPIIVGLVQLGPSPANDGYWTHQAKVNLSAQPRGGAVRVVVRNGTPGDTVTAFVTVA